MNSRWLQLQYEEIERAGVILYFEKFQINIKKR